MVLVTIPALEIALLFGCGSTRRTLYGAFIGSLHLLRFRFHFNVWEDFRDQITAHFV